MKNYLLPSEIELKKLEEILEKKKREFIEIKKELSYFNDREIISTLYKDYNSLLTDREPLKKKLNLNQTNITFASRKLNKIIVKISEKQKWHHKIFGNSDELKVLKNEKQKTEQSILRLIATDKEQQKDFKNIEKNIINTSNSIENFTNFNVNEKLEFHFFLNDEIEVFQVQHKKLYNLNEEIKIATESERQSLNKLYYELGIAEDYDSLLTNEQSASARKLLHREIEEKLGSGNAREILRDRKRKIQNVENRVKDRIIKNQKKHFIKERRKFVLSTCNFIIIDGNNFCYKNGVEYIGIDHLIKFANYLKNNYKLLIIFDKSILRWTKKDFLTIRSLFPKSVEIKIGTSKYEADYSILNYAENEENVFIISNDKFIEFGNEEVVYNNRLIGHEIFSSKILIQDLDINFSF